MTCMSVERAEKEKWTCFVLALIGQLQIFPLAWPCFCWLASCLSRCTCVRACPTGFPCRLCGRWRARWKAQMGALMRSYRPAAQIDAPLFCVPTLATSIYGVVFFQHPNTAVLHHHQVQSTWSQHTPKGSRPLVTS